MVTTLGFSTLKHHLLEYQTRANNSIDFNDITNDSYRDFLKYFNNNKKKVNTIGKNA